jgi:ketosteroid isomerase-like protein
MTDTPPAALADLLNRAYKAFNARDIDGALATMAPDVDWPNLIAGGRVHGRDAVRPYWAGQFETLDPTFEPRRMRLEPDGRVAVEVHQVVRDRAGQVLKDQVVEHVYTFHDGLAARMDVREP